MSGLQVGVTGPTGEIGRSFIRALDRNDEVERIIRNAPRHDASETLAETVSAARAQGVLNAREKDLTS